MRAAAWLCAALLVAAPGLAQEATTPDLPAGDASISGTVVQRATGDGVPNAEVVVYALTPSGAPGLRRLTADANGRFEVEGIAAGGVTYLVGARYDEVSYPGARVSFEAGERTQRVEISVAERSPDTSGVSIEAMDLRVSPAAGGLRVVETLLLHQAGDRTAYVPADARADSAPALHVVLPVGATDFQMPLGVVPEGIARDGEDLRFFGPVYPGRQELTWSYTLPDASGDPEAGSRFALDRSFPDAVGRLELRVPEGGGRVEGGDLVLEEDREDEDGARMRVFSRAGVPPGTALSLAVSLPPSRIDPDAVRVVETRIILHYDDAAADVTETHRLEVTGDTPVLGTAESPLLHVPLPEGARRLRFGSDAGGVSLVPAPDGGLAAVGSAPPGPLNVELAYRLPIDAPPLEITRRFSRRVPLLTVFLADHGTWLPVSDRLHRRRPARTQDLTYAHLEAFEVEPDEPVTLRLERLPGRRPAPEMLLEAGVVVAGLALAFFLVAPLLRRDTDRDEAEAEIPATTRERRFLYEAIHDLEHDFETGKVSEADHARLRDELRARAAALLQAERAAPADAPAPAEDDADAELPAPRRACPACHGPLEPQHRFCPACGHRLAGPPPDSPDAAAGA